MKKTTHLFLTAIMIVCVLFSCKKDENAPSITLLGNNPDTIIVKSDTIYHDAGATAVDMEDGDITSKIVVASNVKTNMTGSYRIYYSVEDDAHNSSERKTRIVEVIKADANYDLVISCNAGGNQSYSTTVTSNASNDTLSLNNFPSAGLITKAALINNKFTIFYQSVSSLVDVDGSLSFNGSRIDAIFNTYTFIGPSQVTDNCTATFVRR